MSDLRAAVAAGVFGTDEAFRALLQSTVETARAIFHAKASSAFSRGLPPSRSGTPTISSTSPSRTARRCGR